MSQDLVETDLRNFLDAQGGDYVLTYDALIEAQAKAEKSVAVRSTKNSRADQWRKALAKKDKSKLRVAYERMRGYVKLARSNSDVLFEENPGVLTYEAAKGLVQQFVDLREIEAGCKADREAIKDRVLASMTEDLAGQGEEFPENVNATIEFPELGVYFDRYGCGRTDPAMNIERLRTELGEDLFKMVTTEKVETTYAVNYDKLMEQARTNPAVLEKVRSSLKQGDWKNPSLTVRNL